MTSFNSLILLIHNNIKFNNRQIHFLVGILLFSTASIAQPVITSFSPSSGPIGSTVTISGSNFSSTPANNQVYFGAVKATVSTATSTSLSVQVPIGATFQPITVTTNQATAYSSKPFIVTFNGAGSISGFSFYEKNDFITDLHPNGIVAADFDGDGKVDIATANNYSILDAPASVSVLLNTSTSGITSFANRMDIQSGVQTFDIASGDFDGDGKQDIAYVSNSDKTLSIAKNNSSVGSISFLPAISYATGINPFAIAVNDIDGDGKPDILVANWLSSTISVYKNQSTGGAIAFLKLADIATAANPYDIALNDMNADGKPDLIVVNYGAKSFSVFLNNSVSGTISFSPKTDFTTGSDFPFSVAVGDIDGDGKPDVVIANDNVTIATPALVSASIFRNTGSGATVSFASKFNLNGTGDAYNISLTDINGDGLIDVVLPKFGNNVSVYQNGSVSGTFAFPILANFSSLSPYSIAVADFDVDGMPDIAASNFTGNNVSVLKNTMKTPRVAFFSPGSGINGNTITITGSNFNSITDVKFGDVPASGFTVNSASSITATVGPGASGDVSVTNSFGTGRLAGFVYSGPPTVTSFSPAVADSGIAVTIKGTNFVNITGVSFGGTPAISYTVVSPSTIIAILGAGTSGNVSVTNGFGTGSLPGMIVAAPTIINFTPSSAATGDTVTINGTNFNAVKSVYFGNAVAASFQILSPSLIKAVVGGGASGTVKLQTVRTVELSGFTFLYASAPVINSFSPHTATVGSTITITGSGFNTISAKNSVYFGAVKAIVQSASATSLVALVPAGATYEPITVINTGTGLSGTSSQNFIVTLPIAATIDGNLLAQQFHSNGEILRPEIADLDGDGKADMVYQQENIQFKNELIIRKNVSTPGSIQFSDSIVIALGYDGGAANRIGPVQLVDMDGDGRRDLVVFNMQYSSIDSIFIFRNTSSIGIISFAPLFKFRLRPDTNIFKLFVADVDADGKPDIITDGGFLSLYLNTSTIGNFNFLPRQDITITGDIIGFADLNNDGKPEGLTANGFNLVVLPNNSTKGVASFGSPVTAYIKGYDYFITSIATGDIDGDNKQDIFLVNSANTAGNFVIIKNTSTGSSFSFVATDYPVSGKVYLGALGDADGDGKTDLFTTSLDLPYILTLYKNNSTAGTITLAARQDYPTPSYYFRLATTDLDNDGKLDVICGGRGIDIFRKASINAPVVTATGSLSICQGDSVTLTSSAKTGNQWYKNAAPINGAINQSITIKDAGSYTVNAKSGNITSGLSIPAVIAVNPVPTAPSITMDGNNNLVSSVTTGNQWYLAGAPIPGATSQTYKPTASGSFSVKTTQNGCTSPSSAAFNYTLTAIEDLGNGRFVKLVPNPIKDYFIVSFNLGITKTVAVQVLGMDGKLLLSKEQITNNDLISLKGIASGMYFIRILGDKGKVQVHFSVIKVD